MSSSDPAAIPKSYEFRREREAVWRELEALELLTSEKIVVTELRPLPVSREERAALPFSLSWHLTREQIARNRTAWDALVEAGSLRALDATFSD